MSSLVIDLKFAGLISQRLERYKVKSNNPFVANFRCLLCGDSEKNTFKARGYFLQGENSVTYWCHNCGSPGVKHLSQIIKMLDPTLYREYLLETFRNERSPTRVEQNENKKEELKVCDLPSIAQLPNTHPAREYLEKRLIPEKFFKELFYADNFSVWTNSHIPNKLNEDNDEGRIVIPFLTPAGDRMFGYQGRAVGNYTPRYITIMLDKEYSHKVYGLNRLDVNKKIYVVEGPFDSLFLPNSIAMCGSDLQSDLILKSNSVIVYDQESRNKDIVRKIKFAIISGYNVAIFGNSFKYKDINEAILAGMTSEEIVEIIDRCSYKGLTAQLEWSRWRKIV